MKKIYYTLVAALVMLVSVSCEKKSPAEQESEGEPGFASGYAEVKPEAGVPDNKVKWVQLWKDGPKWAEFNVGAKSVGEYGCYYAWGGSQDKVEDHNMGDDPLSGDSDTATKLWGEKWRMPTRIEYDALLAYCTSEWKTNYNGTGKNGRLFTGKGDYSGNFVFFPAAGIYECGSVRGDGEDGEYWCSTPSYGSLTFYLSFGPHNQGVPCYSRLGTRSVRAILNE